MKIYKYRLHQIYSTYFINEIPDLDLLAKKLMRENFSNLIYSSNNVLYFNQDGKLFQESLSIAIKPHHPYGEYMMPEGLSEYQQIFSNMSVNYKVHEEYLFSDNIISSFPYIRCFLPKFIAEDDKTRHQFYPSIKIYKTGIIHLDFISFSPEEKRSVSLKEFISDEINLYKKQFNTIKIPLDLLSNNIIENYKMYKEYADIVDRNIEDFSEGEDEFINLDITKLAKEDEYFDLYFIKDYIFESLELILNTKKYKQKNSLGNYWVGKPIAIIEKQALTISEKNRLVKSVINRVVLNKERRGVEQPVNLRPYNDYELYLSESVGLLINQKYKSDSFEEIIAPLIVLEEIIVHLYLLLKQELELVEKTDNLEDILVHNKFILFLKDLIVNKTSRFGEIESIVKSQLFDNYKFEHIDDLLTKKIEAKRVELEYRLNRENNTFIEVITILFGVLGSSPIYENIVKPFFGTDKMKENKQVLFYLATLITTMIVVYAIKFIIKYFRK